LTDTPDAFARTYVEEEAFPEQDWRRRLSSGAKTFVAVLDDRDVGMATGAARRDRDGVAGLFGMWWHLKPGGRVSEFASFRT
jgi:hypothetical protein